MARLILLIVIGFLAWLLVKAIARTLTRKMSDPTENKVSPQAEDMVACVRCGVNLPKSEARLIEGQYRCADEQQCTPRS